MCEMKISRGFNSKGANTSVEHTPSPRVEEGPKLDRNSRYPDMIHNGLSSGGNNGGNGGSRGTGNGPGNGFNDWRMGVEKAYGTVNGERQMVESTLGTRGWVHMEKSQQRNGRFEFEHKMTGHVDGTIHHHIRHPDGEVSDFKDRRSQGTPPAGSLISKVLK